MNLRSEASDCSRGSGYFTCLIEGKKDVKCVGFFPWCAVHMFKDDTDVCFKEMVVIPCYKTQYGCLHLLCSFPFLPIDNFK